MRDAISLQAYFMAHAPVEPQPWFEPAMATPEPQLPDGGHLTQEELEYLVPDPSLGLSRYDVDPDGCPVAVRQFAQKRAQAKAERRQWGREYEHQRHLQWPAAWAEEQLKILAGRENHGY